VTADPTVRSEPDEQPRRRRSWAQRDRIIPKTRQLTFSSRLLFRIDHYTSLPWAALVAAVVLLGAIVSGLFLGFRTGWLTSFEVATSVVTLMMLFVIQHTQGREQAATQRKLDELLRALPEAQSGLMMLEEASDDEMRDVELDQRESKESAVSTSDQPT
jgi:low affinity Fe/Cu permease